MPFFVAADCLDVLDRSCIHECPVDCIYEGDRKMYINPHECIDCGACEPVCPVTAISSDLRLTPDQQAWRRQRGVLHEGPAGALTHLWARLEVPPASGAGRTGHTAGRRNACLCLITPATGYILWTLS